MRRALPFLPSALVLIAVLAAGIGFVQGTMVAVVAWLLLLTVVPGVSLLWLSLVGVWALVTRRWAPWQTVGAVVGALGLLPGLWNLGLLQVPFPLDNDPAKALVMQVPLDGEVIVGWGGDTLAQHYHAAYPDQRFAYDLLVAPAGHGATALDDYGCYGQPVFAGVTGRVHRVVTGVPDQPAGEYVPNLENPTGNSVWIAVDGGFLVLAHLQPGSVAVAEGDTVTPSEVVGACGNSGNTSEPHVHVHVQEQDPNHFPTNMAIGRPLGFLGPDGPLFPAGGIAVEGDEVGFVGDVITHAGGR